MKNLLTVLAVIAFVSFCSAASAETVLSDEDLGELYASDIAVAAQTNNVAITAAGSNGNIENVLSGIDQNNYAKVRRQVDELGTAIAIDQQTNNAALYAGKNVDNVMIEQRNKGKVYNNVWGNGNGATAIAVAAQINNAAITAANGDIKNVHSGIDQENYAKVGRRSGSERVYVTGFGGQAIAVQSQTNNAALYAGKGMDNVQIKQRNKAKVYADVTAQWNALTAVGQQTNNAALYAGTGTIKNISIAQSNYAYVGSGDPM